MVGVNTARAAIGLELVPINASTRDIIDSLIASASGRAWLGVAGAQITSAPCSPFIPHPRTRSACFRVHR